MRALLFLIHALCVAAIFFRDAGVSKRAPVPRSLMPGFERRATVDTNDTDSVESSSTQNSRCRRPGYPGCPRTTTTTTRSPPTPTATPCRGNSANNRQQWCNYNINTDYHNVVPNTGVTREYWLTLDEVNLAPDGFSRPVMAVNGSIPGPLIEASWGDWVVIHVTNNLDVAMNGTSIHWHGIRQNYTNQQDGVVSITQCPTAPGSSYTYRWRATQYGTAWYHSHIGLQAWEGVAGPIVIHGPASANYDIDKGAVLLSDWTHQTADELFTYAQTVGPPTLDNGLINGTNVYGTGSNATGERFTMKVDQGRSYRIRLINAALDTHFKFMIDNHTMTVIAMDLVPVRPFTTDFVSIGMGQRYDVIVTANKSSVAQNFWMRAIPQQACSENDSVDNIKGIFHYGRTAAEPQTSAFNYTDSCEDLPLSSLVPYVPKTVSEADWRNVTDVTVAPNSANLFRWYLNSTTMQVLWEDPTLLQLYNNQTMFPQSNAVIDLPTANQWIYLIINTTIPVDHPIHLHGHDYFVLAQGSNPWDGSVSMNNPPRRDTAMLLGNGYLVLAFQTDNPGAWLMHCHIGWHTSEGFALQFIEQRDKIRGLIDPGVLQDNCASWNTYDQTYDIDQEDSGV